MQLARITPMGNDDLYIEGLDNDGKPIIAHGWISATTQHYTPNQYGENGHLVADAKPREMTQDEIKQYALDLLAEQNAIVVVPDVVAPLFTDAAIAAEYDMKVENDTGTATSTADTGTAEATG